MKSTDPATGELVQVHPDHDDREVSARIEQAAEAQTHWARLAPSERADVLLDLAELLESGRETFAVLMATEMGKPVRQGRSEIDKCAWVCRFYAENGAAFLQDEVIESDASRSFVTYRPLGVILAVMPWNFPFWQVFRLGAPALMAGNGVLLKHAPNVSGCALAIERLFDSASSPGGILRHLLVGEEEVNGLVAHPRIAAASLTGSVEAGSAVAAKAGEEIKRTVLELGGSDPYLVLADADVDSAAEMCVESRLINSGQSCIAAKRFIVVRDVAGEFEQGVVERFQKKRVGPPLEEDTDVGPLAREDLRDHLHRQVALSLEGGARLRTGGSVPDGPGWFYPPTVLTGVRPGMPAFDEELFGPVAAIVVASNEEEAIELANASDYGLGAAVFTRDVERGEHIAARRLQAGAAFVNAFVKSDPRLPFGGIKRSGYGRELSQHGIREFVNAKSIWIA